MVPFKNYSRSIAAIITRTDSTPTLAHYPHFFPLALPFTHSHLHPSAPLVPRGSSALPRAPLPAALSVSGRQGTALPLAPSVGTGAPSRSQLLRAG